MINFVSQRFSNKNSLDNFSESLASSNIKVKNRQIDPPFFLAKHLSVLSLVGYRNMLGSIATRDTLFIRESRHMFREVIKCMDSRGLDPVSLFVRSSEKNNIATSDKAPNECRELLFQQMFSGF